jgi:hypothetical protein
MACSYLVRTINTQYKNISVSNLIGYAITEGVKRGILRALFLFKLR